MMGSLGSGAESSCPLHPSAATALGSAGAWHIPTVCHHSAHGGHQWLWCQVLWLPRCCPGTQAPTPPGSALGICREPWRWAGSLLGTKVQ